MTDPCCGVEYKSYIVVLKAEHCRPLQFGENFAKSVRFGMSEKLQRCVDTAANRFHVRIDCIPNLGREKSLMHKIPNSFSLAKKGAQMWTSNTQNKLCHGHRTHQKSRVEGCFITPSIVTQSSNDTVVSVNLTQTSGSVSQTETSTLGGTVVVVSCGVVVEVLVVLVVVTAGSRQSNSLSPHRKFRELVQVDWQQSPPSHPQSSLSNIIQAN